MTFEDEIQERLVSDRETILEANIDDVEEFFDLHSDGSISIEKEYRDVDDPKKILIYLIAKKYAEEGGLVESSEISTSFFYERLSSAERTIRGYLANLTDEGLVAKESKSEYKIVVENLPDSLERVRGAT